jgi:hypothetical protein
MTGLEAMEPEEDMVAMNPEEVDLDLAPGKK